MHNKPRAAGTFPVYLPARLFASLALRAKQEGLPINERRPSTSGLLRTWLERLAGPPSDWSFPSDEAAIQWLEAEGYSTEQFAGKRFLRAAAADAADAADRRATQDSSGDYITQESITATDRRKALLSKMLAGKQLTAEEQAELS